MQTVDEWAAKEIATVRKLAPASLQAFVTGARVQLSLLELIREGKVKRFGPLGPHRTGATEEELNSLLCAAAYDDVWPAEPGTAENNEAIDAIASGAVLILGRKGHE